MTKLSTEKLQAAEKQLTEQEMRTQYAKLERKAAVEGTLEWFDAEIKNLERGVRELRRYRERFAEAAEKPELAVASAKSHEVLGWAVNEIQNISRNHRLDMVPSHAVRLAKTEK